MSFDGGDGQNRGWHMERTFSQFRDCFADSPVAFCLLGTEENTEAFRFLYRNRAFAALLQADAASAKEEGCADWFTALAPDLYQSIAAAGGSDTSTLYFPATDKYITVQSYRPAAGLCACVLTDTDAGIRRELHAEKRSRELAAAVERAGLRFWEYDVQHACVKTSDATVRDHRLPQKMFDFPESLLRSGYLHPDSVEDYRQLHAEIRAGRLTAERQIRLSDPYGGTWFRVVYNNVLDEDGKPVRAYAMAENINQYKDLEYRFSIAAQSQGFYVWAINLPVAHGAFHNAAGGAAHAGSSDHLGEFCRGEIHPDDLPRQMEMFRKLSAGQKLISGRLRAKNQKTGKWDWFRVRFTTVFDTKGRAVRAIGSAANINAQVAAEKNYAAFLNYQQMAVKSNIFSVQLNLTENCCGIGQCKELQKVALTADSTADDFFAQVYAQFEDPAELERFQDMFHRENLLELYESGTRTLSLECRCVYQGGEERWIRVEAFMEENPNTHEVEALVSATDIDREHTARLLMARLTERDYEFVALLHLKSHRMFLFCESASHPRFVPQDGDFYDEARIPILRQMVRPEYAEQAVEAMRLHTILDELAEKSVYVCTFPTVEADGRTSYKQWKYQYLEQGGNVVLFTRGDVTESYGEELRQKEALEHALSEAERANAAKSEFLSHMSHDLRTPMNGILGTIHIMDKDAASPELQKNLRQLKNTSQYMLSLISDVLDMQQIEGRRITLCYETVNSAQVLEDVLASVQAAIAEKHLHFEFYPVNMDLARVRLDKVRVQQIFTNVLSNAVKFTPEGGTIVLCMECLRRDAHYAYDRISIQDTGIGMHPDFLPKLFLPFEQEAAGVMAGNGGTGLGMSIVKHLVDLMGGTIHVDSTLGVGTKVTVELAFELAEDAEEQEVPAAVDYGTALQGKRVLLCEDHPLNREIAVRLLAEQGVEAESAENGEIGLKLFCQSAVGYYDAVLMDIRMPVMDGFTAASEIRRAQRPDAKNIPIIAMTANAFAEDLQKSAAAGMNAHLAKPVDPELLYRTLGIMVTRSPAMRALPETGSVVERLHTWGCDTENAIARCCGDETLFLSLLPEVDEDVHFQQLEQALAEHQLRKAFEEAHTLKGLLGNMGITPLYRPVVELTDLLRAGSDDGAELYLKKIRALHETFSRLIAADATQKKE